jgi:hypothetical protein
MRRRCRKSPKISKEIVSRDEHSLKDYTNEKVLSVQALVFFPVSCFLVDEKMKLKAFA